MAFRVFTSDSIGAGVQATLATTDDLYIAAGVTVGRTDATVGSDATIVGTGSQHRVDVAGTVLGLEIAIDIGDSKDDSDNIVNIAASGVVRGYEWASAAVRMNGTRSELINAGDLWARNSGVLMYSYGETTSKITNTGTIAGGNDGIFRVAFAEVDGIISVDNSGTISGGVSSYHGGSATAKDLITNTGRMIGDIWLGRGDDLYNGTAGRLSGKVYGGEGNDEIRGGADNDTFFGEQGNEKLYGGTGNDTLHGGADRDLLNGGAGADKLYGGVGADKLYGGSGADTFVFTSTSDTTVASSGRDTIYDFSRTQKDKIDLKAIDASTKAGGDQAFTFIGTEAFHKKAGELRYEIKGGDTYIHGDVNGDGKADFSIVLDLALAMNKADFVL